MSLAFIEAERRSIEVVGNPLPNTTNWCLRCNAEAYGLPDALVEVRVTSPTVKPQRGTVVLFSGGYGDDWFTDGSPTAPQSGKQLINALLALGFLCIEMRWPDNWLGPLPGGFIARSSRPAALLEWIREHYSGPYAAVGNSGGTGALGFALTTHEITFLSVAVLGSGMFVELEYSCGVEQPAWTAIAVALFNAYSLGTNLQCSPVERVASPTGLLCPLLTGRTFNELQADSVDHPGALLNFPTTKIHTICGGLDCSVAVLHGLRFYDQVTSQRGLSFVLGTEHWIPETTAGRAAIVAAVTAVL